MTLASALGDVGGIAAAFSGGSGTWTFYLPQVVDGAIEARIQNGQGFTAADAVLMLRQVEDRDHIGAAADAIVWRAPSKGGIATEDLRAAAFELDPGRRLILLGSLLEMAGGR